MPYLGLKGTKCTSKTKSDNYDAEVFKMTDIIL